MAHRAEPITPFSTNPDFHFETRSVLGLAVGGGAERGEVLAATTGIHHHDRARWFRACTGWGRPAQSPSGAGGGRPPGQQGPRPPARVESAMRKPADC